MDNSAEIFTEAKMKIRKAPAEVFNALIDPRITTKFWFTKSTAKLVEGTKVTWTWEMYGVSADVQVLQVKASEKIVFEWGPKRRVEIIFQELGDNTTYVIIKESGYTESGRQLIEIIKDSTGGFTTLLDGMKAYVEHGIQLQLVLDKYPAGK